MNGWAWVQLLAATSGLVLALLAVTRGGGNRLAFSLTLLALDQFAWNAASVGFARGHDERYAWVGAVAAPLFTPLAFHFVLTFLGRRQAGRRWLAFAYALFGLQALVGAVLGLGGASVAAVSQLSVVLLATSLPFAVAAVVLVQRHRASTANPLERWRATVLIGGLVVVLLLFATDLLADFGLPVPRLATLGSLTFNLALMLLTLGLGLFEHENDRVAAIGQAVVLGLFAAVAYLLVFDASQARLGVLLTSSTALSLCLAAGAWFFVRRTQLARGGLERFATLGRFSAQMAHDLRNPLAAAKGAAEYLAEELRRANQPEQQDFAQLIVQQLDRLGAVISRYQRLSAMTPEFAQVDLNALVGRVLALQAFGNTGVEFKQALAPGLLMLKGDGDLLASALENLVKNALEAMPDGGVLTVGTRLEADDVASAVLSVQDQGVGMDARAREQAFELFFTTKATGSGLGLAFVQQVAQAHRGQVRLVSSEAQGTLVEVMLPLAPERG
jgi:two-component system sensor histidine kinase HydH